MIGCLRTRVHKQPIIALYFEFEIVLKFYNLKATGLYSSKKLAGLKAGESSDTSMSTCGGVGHITGHWKSNKTLAPLLLIGGVEVTDK